ncbi:hypothetical protein KL916_005433 [Ogataea parapolymorpha]|nr:hypothetical protein KL916_005433 [Ogataea parapolymorpha]
MSSSESSTASSGRSLVPPRKASAITSPSTSSPKSDNHLDGHREKRDSKSTITEDSGRLCAALHFGYHVQGCSGLAAPQAVFEERRRPHYCAQVWRADPDAVAGRKAAEDPAHNAVSVRLHAARQPRLYRAHRSELPVQIRGAGPRSRANQQRAPPHDQPAERQSQQLEFAGYSELFVRRADRQSGRVAKPVVRIHQGVHARLPQPAQSELYTQRQP